MTEHGFIYAIGAPNGYVKIGKAGDGLARFTSTQTCSPVRLTLVYLCKCVNPREIELAAHQALAHRWRRGEWFEVSTSDAVNAVRTAFSTLRNGTMSHPQRTHYKRGAPIRIIPLINEIEIGYIESGLEARQREKDDLKTA